MAVQYTCPAMPHTDWKIWTAFLPSSTLDSALGQLCMYLHKFGTRRDAGPRVPCAWVPAMGEAWLGQVLSPAAGGIQPTDAYKPLHMQASTSISQRAEQDETTTAGFAQTWGTCSWSMQLRGNVHVHMAYIRCTCRPGPCAQPLAHSWIQPEAPSQAGTGAGTSAAHMALAKACSSQGRPHSALEHDTLAE